jgi:formylglycine-generating enzyme required for sulfatase activity
LIILDGVDMVEIPGGSFWMGWDEGGRGERPRHRVWTEAFAIARAPVTNQQYAPFLDAAGIAPPPWWSDPRFSHPDQPVVGVTWFEAQSFCEWLSAHTGRAHRLPTEAEWEKAARAGRDGARFPWGDDRPDEASFDRPPILADMRANPVGLVGLSGVCHEWCLDWEDPRYYAVSPERNPQGPPSGTRKSSRGGAWRHQDPWSPIAHRSSLPPALGYSDYGFRVVCYER